MSDRIAGFAFKTARGIGKRPAAGWLFCLIERILPLQRVAREGGVVAFHHPRPIEDPHVLVVPTRPISALTSNRLGVHEKATIVWQMVTLAKVATETLPPHPAWKFVINGGTRQDVGQLHGHVLRADNAPEQTGFRLVDPDDDLEAWSQLDRQIREADAIPDNGYSLIVRWSEEVEPRATITQSV